MNGELGFTIPAEEYADPAGMNFKEYIRCKMKSVRSRDGRRTVTAAELADALGLNIKVFRDILNGRRSGPDRRDFIIALCAELGLDNYKDNKLETLAKHGNGVYRVVNNLNDVKKSIRDEYASLVNIIAKDVKAQVEFNPETVESFRLLGFENRELRHEEFTDDTVISEPFGSGGYGVALYELVMRNGFEARTVENRYTRVVTTGSSDLGTVKVRYKEPLEDVSHEIEHVIADTQEHYSDNLLLASIVYVCAEKLRGSDMIEARDEALALADLDRLGMEIKVLNLDDLDKLRVILQRSRERLGVYMPFDEDDLLF